jgi:hypothetical protein
VPPIVSALCWRCLLPRMTEAQVHKRKQPSRPEAKDVAEADKLPCPYCGSRGEPKSIYRHIDNCHKMPLDADLKPINKNQCLWLCQYSGCVDFTLDLHGQAKKLTDLCKHVRDKHNRSVPPKPARHGRAAARYPPLVEWVHFVIPGRTQPSQPPQPQRQQSAISEQGSSKDSDGSRDEKSSGSSFSAFSPRQQSVSDASSSSSSASSASTPAAARSPFRPVDWLSRNPLSLSAVPSQVHFPPSAVSAAAGLMVPSLNQSLPEVGWRVPELLRPFAEWSLSRWEEFQLPAQTLVVRMPDEAMMDDRNSDMQLLPLAAVDFYTQCDADRECREKVLEAARTDPPPWWATAMLRPQETAAEGQLQHQPGLQFSVLHDSISISCHVLQWRVRWDQLQLPNGHRASLLLELVMPFFGDHEKFYTITITDCQTNQSWPSPPAYHRVDAYKDVLAQWARQHDWTSEVKLTGSSICTQSAELSGRRVYRRLQQRERGGSAEQLLLEYEYRLWIIDPFLFPTRAAEPAWYSSAHEAVSRAEEAFHSPAAAAEFRLTMQGAGPLWTLFRLKLQPGFQAPGLPQHARDSVAALEATLSSLQVDEVFNEDKMSSIISCSHTGETQWLRVSC